MANVTGDESPNAESRREHASKSLPQSLPRELRGFAQSDYNKKNGDEHRAK